MIPDFRISDASHKGKPVRHRFLDFDGVLQESGLAPLLTTLKKRNHAHDAYRVLTEDVQPKQALIEGYLNQVPGGENAVRFLADAIASDWPNGPTQELHQAVERFTQLAKVALNVSVAR